MAKDKKASSKTARVLGLLTSSAAEETEEPESVPEQPEPPRPPVPANDSLVEAEVRTALQRELEVELEESPFPRRRRGSRNRAGSRSEPEDAAQEPPIPSQPVYQPAPRLPEEAAQEPGPKAKPRQRQEIATPSHPSSGLEPEIVCFNITQALVEAKVDKYISLFGLCGCPRCRIDVIALALTNLPPKYVVAGEQEMEPLLAVYESRYNAAIVSQVMSACKLVMEHPRHDNTD